SCWRYGSDELVLAIALEIEQGRQIAMTYRGARLAGDDRLGAEGDAQPSRADHVEIIGAVPDGQGLLRLQIQLVAQSFKCGQLRLPAEDRRHNLACQAAIGDVEPVRLVRVEAEARRDALG